MLYEMATVGGLAELWVIDTSVWGLITSILISFFAIAFVKSITKLREDGQPSRL
jgi:hypothetical protein